MTKTIKILAAIGLCGGGIAFLAGLLSLVPVTIIGVVMLFACTTAVIVCTAIKGYNPVEP